MTSSFLTLAPLLSMLLLFALSTLIGVTQVAKMIKVYEARHELKQGSAGFIRSISGWSMIAIWLGFVWFTATVLGDWWATEDLTGALSRAGVRLRVLLEILAALADSD